MSRVPYAPEFKEQLVELARSGRSVASLPREFEPTETTIAKWVKELQIVVGLLLDQGCQDGLWARG